MCDSQYNLRATVLAKFYIWFYCVYVSLNNYKLHKWKSCSHYIVDWKRKVFLYSSGGKEIEEKKYITCLKRRNTDHPGNTSQHRMQMRLKYHHSMQGVDLPNYLRNERNILTYDAFRCIRIRMSTVENILEYWEYLIRLDMVLVAINKLGSWGT